MGIIEKEKNFRAILAAPIILIGKRLSRSELSSLVENHLLTCAIRFCFCFVFSNFFVNMLFFTKLCWNFDKYSLWHAFCSFFCFLVFNFYSLLFIDFAFFLSAWFLNNSNKYKKCSIALSCIKLGTEALSVWGKDKDANFGEKSTEGNLPIVVYTYIFLFFLVRFVQPHLLFCCKILHFFGIFKYQKERIFRSLHILDVLVPQSCLNLLLSTSCNVVSKQGVGIRWGEFFSLGNNNSGELSLTRLK